MKADVPEQYMDSLWQTDSQHVSDTGNIYYFSWSVYKNTWPDPETIVMTVWDERHSQQLPSRIQSSFTPSSAVYELNGCCHSLSVCLSALFRFKCVAVIIVRRYVMCKSQQKSAFNSGKTGPRTCVLDWTGLDEKHISETKTWVQGPGFLECSKIQITITMVYNHAYDHCMSNN